VYFITFGIGIVQKSLFKEFALIRKRLVRRIKFLVLLLLMSIVVAKSQDTLYLSCAGAIEIALEKSYSARSFEVDKQAMRYYFSYYKATFKPMLDLNLYTPIWQESVTEIEQANGLPVYNSTGSLQVGGDVTFTYVLPSGGNLSLSSNIYRQNLSTVLASDNSTLKTDLFNSRFRLYFTQPIFTKNKLRENLNEAEYKYQQSEHYYTRAQMDIVYDVTQEFYALYRSKKQVEISLEKLTNSEESFRIAKLKLKGGRMAQGDVMSAEVSVAQNKAAHLKAYNQMQNEEDRLRQLIGLDLNHKIGIITNLEYRPILINEQKATEEALKNRLEIKETEMDINLLKIEVDRAKRIREFKGNISAYYDLTGISTLGSGTTAELAGSSFDNIRNRPPNRGIALTFSVPIYDWGRGSSKVKEAQFNLQSKELYKYNQEVTIRREVFEIIRLVNESVEQLNIYQKNLELARQTYLISQARFENGDLSNQDLTIEQERLAKIQLDYLDAFIGYQLSVNNLKRKTMWDFENNRSYLVQTDMKSNQ
jgi:outer membrane protein